MMAEKYMEVDLLKMAIEAEPFFTDSTKAAFRNIVNKVPTVDAVEVVRCRNCVHWECFADEPCMGECHNTLKWSGVYKTTYDCDFCSEGERREDDG